MEIYTLTMPPTGRYIIQLGNMNYRRWSEGDISRWHSPKFFKGVVASGHIKLVDNPPIEIINEFEAFRVKLILGFPHGDI